MIKNSEFALLVLDEMIEGVRHIKKLFVLVMMILFLLCGLISIQKADSDTAKANVKVTELHYRYRLETNNPLWHLLFFIFSGSNREFLWREKTACDEGGGFREIAISNKNNQELIKFFSRNGVSRGKLNLGDEIKTKELNSEQAKVWLEIQDFTRSAKAGDAYKAIYQGSEDVYEVIVKSRQEMKFSVSRGRINVLYFEGEVWKKTEKFLDIKIWVARESELKSQVVKCSFKLSFWPMVVVEII